MKAAAWRVLIVPMLAAAAALLPPAAAAGAATGLERAAAALEEGPVYVDPRASDQLSDTQADALERKIENADKPVFVAVLPANSDFPPDNLLRNLRTEVGITGVYAIRLGDGFDAAADRTVLSNQAVDNITTAVKATPVDAETQLNNFVDQALAQARGTAPASWNSSAADEGVPVGGLVTLGAVLAAGGAGAYALSRRSRRRREEEEQAALEKVRVVVDEDITAFGEELDRLDFHPGEPGATDAMRSDYEKALDSYDRAKTRMAAARRPDDVREVTEALEDGRFALAVLAARRAGFKEGELPERRPPCFFDPRHGPSAQDVPWTPAGGAARDVPVCAADAARLAEGEDPVIRTVDTPYGRRPYWEAGPAYGPWAGGYFGGGILPGLLIGTMLGSAMSGPAHGGDFGGFEGGDTSGGDFFSGDFGGGDFGGGGGFDGGGGF
ncbi:hypothetical protein [Streptomyces sp. GC420]|uniref:hypothetical protein n=1 Tax=Streptomyces sp. GC420 TaxID=2697568 RepID=UPI001414F65C|nr:hypothetical protein [Streptomyces sp. GC420]NBM19380.1 hypothetical protein [Streptomyces sp. GC420]